MIVRIAALAAAALSFAAPAQAATVKAQEPRSVIAALQGAGYNAQLGTDKVGDPMVTSAVSGTKFQILFYNCKDHTDCRTVQFYSAYKADKPVPVERMNAFNSENRFGRAYLDKENDPVLVMDIDLDDGGMSDALFIDNIEFWATVLADFERQIGFRS